MTITVYSVSGAPRPWRVLLGLTFKSLDFNIHLLEVSKGALKSEEFLAINPRGTVPVFVDGDTIIRDSIASLIWLDQAYPNKPLFGNTVKETAEILQMSFELGDYLRTAQDNLVRPILFAGADKATPQLLESADSMTFELNKLEQRLEKTTFLMGEKPSAADAVAFPEIRIIQRVAETKPDIMKQLGFDQLGTAFPSLEAWKKRIEQLPGVDKTFPKHWGESG